MINILLVCSAGMSTSMLVKKMKESADNRGIEANIWAVGDADSKEATQKADIVMLGPQVRYLETKMRAKVDNKIPVAVIDMRVYGTMNGESALDSALEILKKFKGDN